MRLNFHSRALRTVAMLALPAAAAAALAQAAPQQSYQPPRHSGDWPGLASGKTQAETQASLRLGPELQRGRSAKWTLAEHRRLAAALAAIGKQRPGKVDAYVVAIGLDSDPVFGREAREAGKVLSARFGAAGRTLVLAGTDGTGPSRLAHGSLASLTLALARVAEVMDTGEDVLVLYATSHGMQIGIAYHDGDEGYGILAPARLAALLDELGIRNRLLILSACYSGVFVPYLASETSAVLTAASSSRPSFGCMADNDWTFFGDALLNHALRKPQPLAAASDEAHGLIGKWESEARLQSSEPQTSIGAGVARWLAPLEAAMPRTASRPVGKPATEALKKPGGG